jgi:hypothetical protein
MVSEKNRNINALIDKKHKNVMKPQPIKGRATDDAS